MNNLGNYLKNRRESLGLPQSVIAERMGYRSTSLIGEWEKGYHLPSTKAIKRLVAAYELDPNTFLTHLAKQSYDRLKEALK